MKRSLIPFFLLCLSQLLAQVPNYNEAQAGIYYSDYFSFHGVDEKGQVLFAIDNNRKLSKKGSEANNFLYFNEGGEWQKLKGHKKFKSQEPNMERVPSNEDFEFLYDGDHLSEIISPSNDFRLEFEASLRKTGDYGTEGMLFEIYTTQATMYFGDRVVRGNLISEKLIDSVGLKSFGNIMKGLFGGFKFDGYYLNVPGLGDLYAHAVDSKLEIGMMANDIFNLTTNEGPIDFNFTESSYKVTKTKRIGFKKLPLEIEITLPEATLTLRTNHFQTYRNVLFFAFGMGVVEGELAYKGETYPVFGISEVFEF